MYLKNVIIDRKGNPRLVKFLTDENSSLEERYYKWVKSKADKDAKNYVRRLASDVISEMRKKFSEKFSEINEKLNEDITSTKDSLYSEWVETSKAKLKENLTTQEAYMVELFRRGSAIFKTLDSNTKEKILGT